MMVVASYVEGKELWEDQTEQHILVRICNYGEVVTFASLLDVAQVVDRSEYHLLVDTTTDVHPKVYLDDTLM